MVHKQQSRARLRTGLCVVCATGGPRCATVQDRPRQHPRQSHPAEPSLAQLPLHPPLPSGVRSQPKPGCHVDSVQALRITPQALPGAPLTTQAGLSSNITPFSSRWTCLLCCQPRDHPVAYLFPGSLSMSPARKLPEDQGRVSVPGTDRWFTHICQVMRGLEPQQVRWGQSLWSPAFRHPGSWVPDSAMWRAGWANSLCLWDLFQQDKNEQQSLHIRQPEKCFFYPMNQQNGVKTNSLLRSIWSSNRNDCEEPVTASPETGTQQRALQSCAGRRWRPSLPFFLPFPQGWPPGSRCQLPSKGPAVPPPGHLTNCSTFVSSPSIPKAGEEFPAQEKLARAPWRPRRQWVSGLGTWTRGKPKTVILAPAGLQPVSLKGRRSHQHPSPTVNKKWRHQTLFQAPAGSSPQKQNSVNTKH